MAIDLSTLNGTNGFRLGGAAAYDNSGFSVSAAGDVNGDGIADVIVGAPFADPSGRYAAGSSYVVFVKTTGFAASLDLATLTGADGFRLDGAAAYDQSARAVSAAGDVNGDGIGDLIVGAPYADPSGRNYAGSSYVVFGKTTGFASSLDLAALTGADGFRLDGATQRDYSGRSVSAAGDVNGDGFGDLIVGAAGRYAAGSSYVVFGKGTGFAASVDLAALTAADGFRLNSAEAGDYTGWSVSEAGDVNGDGIGDLIVGAPRADAYGGIGAGSSYVVFGKTTGFSASVDLATLTGADGFRLDGAAQFDSSGWSVSAAGDVNGDGIDDVIVGAPKADPSGRNYAGSSYVVFGKTEGFAASLDLGALTAADGFRLDGAASYDFDGIGFSVSAAGDVNGDGIGDLIVGAPQADPSGGINAGSSYVVFGKATGFGASLDLATLTDADGFRLDGVASYDISGFSVSAAGDVNGDGLDDLIIGAKFAEPGGRSYAGESYVVFGFRSTITGTARGEVLRGTGASETFLPLQGNDTVRAAGGDDVILASRNDGNDSYLGHQGSDTVDHSALTASVNVELGALFGGGIGRAKGKQSGVDTLDSIENVVGSRAGDTIKGNGNANVLDGDAGNDDLTGGGQADVFVFSRGSDRITDFDAIPANGQDRIDLRGLGISAATFAAEVVISDLGSSTRVVVDGVGSALLPGVSGSGSNAIDESDFLLL
jgi:hypothetical protein